MLGAYWGFWLDWMVDEKIEHKRKEDVLRNVGGEALGDFDYMAIVISVCFEAWKFYASCESLPPAGSGGDRRDSAYDDLDDDGTSYATPTAAAAAPHFSRRGLAGPPVGGSSSRARGAETIREPADTEHLAMALLNHDRVYTAERSLHGQEDASPRGGGGGVGGGAAAFIGSPGSPPLWGRGGISGADDYHAQSDQARPTPRSSADKRGGRGAGGGSPRGVMAPPAPSTMAKFESFPAVILPTSLLGEGTYHGANSKRFQVSKDAPSLAFPMLVQQSDTHDAAVALDDGVLAAGRSSDDDDEHVDPFAAVLSMSHGDGGGLGNLAGLGPGARAYQLPPPPNAMYHGNAAAPSRRPNPHAAPSGGVGASRKSPRGTTTVGNKKSPRHGKNVRGGGGGGGGVRRPQPPPGGPGLIDALQRVGHRFAGVDTDAGAPLSTPHLAFSILRECDSALTAAGLNSSCNNDDDDSTMAFSLMSPMTPTKNGAGAAGFRGGSGGDGDSCMGHTVGSLYDDDGSLASYLTASDTEVSSKLAAVGGMLFCPTLGPILSTADEAAAAAAAAAAVAAATAAKATAAAAAKTATMPKAQAKLPAANDAKGPATTAAAHVKPKAQAKPPPHRAPYSRAAAGNATASSHQAPKPLPKKKTATASVKPPPPVVPRAQPASEARPKMAQTPLSVGARTPFFPPAPAALATVPCGVTVTAKLVPLSPSEFAVTWLEGVMTTAAGTSPGRHQPLLAKRP